MTKLIGIAKFAAEAPTLEAKRQVSYFELQARRYVTKADSSRVPFQWMINPYRGCEYGCKYCYARYTHEFMELRDPLQFEQQIYAKSFDANRFRAELKHIPIGESVAIGTATDPYQPAENRYFVMRRMLEVFATTAGLRLHITTKSNVVARDVDILPEVARRHYLTVSMTITTLDTGLARLLEPMAPRPDLRLAAIKTLSAAGISTRVGCSPVMPLINDSEESFEQLAQQVRAAGATRMGAGVLFLKPCASQVFLPFLKEHFPALVRRYQERFQNHAYLRGAYPALIRARVARVRQKHWPEPPPPMTEPELWPHDQQLELFPDL